MGICLCKPVCLGKCHLIVKRLVRGIGLAGDLGEWRRLFGD